MRLYRVVDSIIKIEGEIAPGATEYLKKFSIKNSIESECDICFLQLKQKDSDEEMEKIRKQNLISKPVDSVSFYGVEYHRLIQGWKHLITHEEDFKDRLLVANDAWNHLMIIDNCEERKAQNQYKGKYPLQRKDFVMNDKGEWMSLFLIGFYSFASLRKTMMIHASAVKYQDKAVLFTAPSGTGKTTQAELWRDLVNAKILNGDRIFIKYADEDSILYAWGSPWSGSSPYIENDFAEIAAIIVLEQATENSLQRIDAKEAMIHLSSNSFLPMWDAKCLEGMLGVMDQVLRKVPIYRLACRPDEEAVELLRKELFG